MRIVKASPTPRSKISSVGVRESMQLRTTASGNCPSGRRADLAAEVPLQRPAFAETARCRFAEHLQDFVVRQRLRWTSLLAVIREGDAIADLILLLEAEQAHLDLAAGAPLRFELSDELEDVRIDVIGARGRRSALAPRPGRGRTCASSAARLMKLTWLASSIRRTSPPTCFS